MNDHVFQKRYEGLNLAQKKAVDTVEGPVMVIAGPGTGKTTVLTLRIANILRTTDTQPENILALTFTESGVTAMRKKLRELIGTTAFRVPIYTFHGFANMVIQTYPEDFESIIGRTALADHEGARIIDELLLGKVWKYLSPKNDPLYYSSKLLSAIATLKEATLSPDGYRDFLKREKNAIESSEDFVHEKGAHKGKVRNEYKKKLENIEKSFELADFYESYEEKLVEQKRYDFNDMILTVVRVLKEGGTLLGVLQETYQYILADEHQDINTAQNTLIELLASFYETPNLFVVGDDKQAIYRFQGASTENFVYLPKRFSNVLKITLTENYRSTQHILDASHTVIQNQTDLIAGESLLACLQKDSERVEVIEAENRRSEINWIAESIKEKIDSGILPETIAILYHNNAHAEGLYKSFREKDIFAKIHSSTDLFTHPLVEQILLGITACSNPTQDSELARLLLFRYFDIDILDVYELIKEHRQNRVSIIRVLKEKFPDAYEKIMHINEVLREEGAVTAFEYLLKEGGYIERALKGDADGNLRAIDTLLSLVRTLQEGNHTARGIDIEKHINLYISHGLRIKSGASDTEAGKVNLMTAHNSKGLEFDYVYVVHVENGIWGGKQSKKYFTLPELNVSGTIEDERRLFYVALTRAKKHAAITYAKNKDDGKEVLPSQFIDELGEKCIERKKARIVALEEALQKVVRTKGNSLTDQFVKDIFLRQGLTVTALNNYLTCPWKFFFQNLIRIPHTPSPSQQFGTAIHKALQVGQDTAAGGHFPTYEDVSRIFVDTLMALPLDDTEFEKRKKHGLEVLDAYCKEYKDTAWVKDAKTEYTVKDVMLSVDDFEILLHGKIDRLELLADNAVRVVDYKTGKQKTKGEILGTTQSSNGDLFRQLVFYKILLDAHKGGAYHMLDATLDFVEPNKDGKLKKETFAITKEQSLELLEEVREVVREIYTVAFWNARCDDANCEFCALRDHM